MKILYFARFRQLIGRGSDEITPPPEVNTVAELLSYLMRTDNGCAAAFADAKVIRAAVDQAHVKEVLEAFHNPNFNVDLRAVANQRGEEVFVVAIGAVAKPLTGYHSAADLSALLRSTSEPQLIAVDLHQKIFNERPTGLPAPKLPLEGMRLELLQTAPANPAQVSSPNAMVYEIGDYAALSVPSTGAVDLKEIARLATLEFGELEGRMDTTFIRSGDLRLVQFHMSREHHGDLLAFAKKLGVEELPPST